MVDPAVVKLVGVRCLEWVVDRLVGVGLLRVQGVPLLYEAVLILFRAAVCQFVQLFFDDQELVFILVIVLFESTLVLILLSLWYLQQMIALIRLNRK